MINFLAAIVRTARGWADTSQTFMPAFRGRVAWVRQRAGEGGASLFMPRATVASLALRGALAGARLTKRFADEAHWRRHQWVRLRVAMGNLSDLRRNLAVALRSLTYTALLADPARVDRIRDELYEHGGDPSPAKRVEGTSELERPLEWFDVKDTYWEAARMIAGGYSAYDATVLTEGDPDPAPVIRQTPPL